MFDAALELVRVHLVHVPGFAFVASAPYLFRPFVMLVTLAVTTAVVGVLINLRQAEFSAETMVHAVFPGIVAGVIWRGLDGIIPGAMLVAVCAAAVLTWIPRRGSDTGAHGLGASEGGSEATSAIVLATFYAAGIVLSLKHSDKSGQLEALMFGRLLELSATRMAAAMCVCIVACLLLAACWRRQLAVAFDRTGAQASGISVLAMDAIFNGAIALVVCAASSAVGVLLAVGLLLVPGVAARLLSRSATRLVPVALGFSLVSTYVGLHIPQVFPAHPVSPQACVALSGCLCLFVLLAFRQVASHVRKGSK